MRSCRPFCSGWAGSMRSISIPRRSHQTESLDRPKSELELGTHRSDCRRIDGLLLCVDDPGDVSMLINDGVRDQGTKPLAGNVVPEKLLGPFLFPSAVRHGPGRGRLTQRLTTYSSQSSATSNKTPSVSPLASTSVDSPRRLAICRDNSATGAKPAVIGVYRIRSSSALVGTRGRGPATATRWGINSFARCGIHSSSGSLRRKTP